MKTFQDLTGDQQQSAIEFAEKTMNDSLGMGILRTSKFLSTIEIHELAVVAAEEGEYDENGKPATDILEVPFRFLGGCV